MKFRIRASVISYIYSNYVPHVRNLFKNELPQKTMPLRFTCDTKKLKYKKMNLMLYLENPVWLDAKAFSE